MTGKWTLGTQAMFAAEGEILESDVKQLITRMTSGDLTHIAEVYIDLNSASYISPLAVSLLYIKYTMLTANNRRLVFLNPNNVSSAMLRLFGANYVFPVLSGM